MSRARVLADFVGGTTTISGTPTFTGTVTGAGTNSGLRFIKKVTLTSSNGVFSATNLFSADFSHYQLFWEIKNSTNNTLNHFRWIKASDNTTVDTAASIDSKVIGEDNDGADRSKSINDANYWVIEDNALENTHKQYMVMNCYDPFSSTEKATVSGTGAYNVNDNDDVVSYIYAASTSETTSYSGIQLTIATSIGGSADTSNTLTGKLMVYGYAES